MEAPEPPASQSPERPAPAPPAPRVEPEGALAAAMEDLARAQAGLTAALAQCAGLPRGPARKAAAPAAGEAAPQPWPPAPAMAARAALACAEAAALAALAAQAPPAAQQYPPSVVARTLAQAFFPYRGLALAPRSLGPGAGRAPTDDEIVSSMGRFAYARLDARRRAPRGGRDWVVVLVLDAKGAYVRHGPDLRDLLTAVGAEEPAPRLDELILVAEDEFFMKKNLTDVVREFQRREAGGPDAAGAAPIYNAYRYCAFAAPLPLCSAVAPHRVLAPAEVAALLREQRCKLGDLPVILTDDPPVIWNGARQGQVVEVTRDSHTAMAALYWRRVERAGP